MHLGVFISVIGLCSFVPAGAAPAAPNPAIDPLRVKCTLREKQFFTDVLFSRNSNDELVGEMSHYVSTKDHGRRFLSGSIFFEITSDSTQIRGNTGDPRGIVTPFILKPVNNTQLTGRWVYVQFDSSGRKTQVHFRCVYSEG